MARKDLLLKLLESGDIVSIYSPQFKGEEYSEFEKLNTTNPIMDEVRKRYLTPEIQKQVDMQVMIANRIYDLLEQKGMSQKDLAQKLGKTETEVSRWLCGTHNMTIATLAKIAVVLDDNLITPTVTKGSRYRMPTKLSRPKRVAVML